MISVIIPVYNIESVVDYAIKSILNQTFSDWEVILVDDGSTDHSPEICDSYAATDSRIKVVHKYNGGLSSARNAGLDVAKGEYIMLLDGDDYLHPTTLKALNNTMIQYPDLSFIQFHYKEVNSYQDYDCGTFSEIISELEVISSEEQWFYLLYNLGGVAASACTKIYKRDIFDAIRFKEGILHEDEDFTTQLLGHVLVAGYCTNEYYRYVMRPGSIIHTDFTPSKMWTITVLEDRIEYLRKRQFQQLTLLNSARLFHTLYRLHGEATALGFNYEKKVIEKKVLQLSKIKNIPINGKLSLIYHAGPLSIVVLRIFTQLHLLYVHHKKNS